MKKYDRKGQSERSRKKLLRHGCDVTRIADLVMLCLILLRDAGIHPVKQCVSSDSSTASSEVTQ